MPTPAKHLNPVDLKAIFGLEPSNAIAYLKRKGYAITWHWQDIRDQAHDQAFTVAKAMRLDLLSDIRAALETALQQGQTLKQFTAHLKPVLQAQGWWGKQIIVDSQGTAERGQLGSARRLKTIYQTNLQSAYMAGRKASMEQTTSTHPYWMAIAILDSKTRPSHRALHGHVMRHNDPIWSAIYPPNGFNCRCRVIALSEAAVKRRGLTITSSQGKTFTETVETSPHKHTGEITTATITGLRLTNAQGHTTTFRTDPGFNHAPGTDLAQALKQKAAAAQPHTQ